MRRHRDMSLVCQVREEPLDLDLPHVPRMARAVIADESAGPIYVGLFGTEAVMQISDAFAQTCKQSGRFGRTMHSRRRARGITRSWLGSHNSCIFTQPHRLPAIVRWSYWSPPPYWVKRLWTFGTAMTRPGTDFTGCRPFGTTCRVSGNPPFLGKRR